MTDTKLRNFHEAQWDEDIIFEGNGKCVRTPIGITVFDFIRACELCEIELELSDYAMSLVHNLTTNK